MELSQAQSASLIDGLAQAAPFRFIDRVCFLDDERVVTELHRQDMPQRFADADALETYAALEFAAQSSGLLLRGRKLAGARGVIASFRGIEAQSGVPLRLPLRLESRLVSARWTLFEFDFAVYVESQLALVGNIGIVIGRT